MHQILFFPARRLRFLVIALVVAVVHIAQTQAQSFIVSTIPANGSSGVSPSAAVVFTFNEQMDTALTMVQFIDTVTFMSLPTSFAWSANDTVLTCTPTPAFGCKTKI